MSYHEELKEFRKKYPYQQISAGGAVFRYVLAGKEGGQALVLLNGGMNISEMWMRYMDDLSRDYRVLIFDYPMELKTNQELITGMNALFGALGIESPVLIGASDGGMVAQLYTQKYSTQVGGLVLIATGGMDEHTLRQLKRKYFLAPLMLWYMKHTDYEKMKPKLIRMGIKHAEHESAEHQLYAKGMFETLFEDYTREKDVHITGLLYDLLRQTPVTAEHFRQLKGKILLILPSQDFFSADMQKSLAALMHDPEIRQIEGGHAATIFRADEYVRLIQEFIAQSIQ